jgi:hypothetical protein
VAREFQFKDQSGLLFFSNKALPPGVSRRTSPFLSSASSQSAPSGAWRTSRMRCFSFLPA